MSRAARLYSPGRPGYDAPRKGHGRIQAQTPPLPTPPRPAPPARPSTAAQPGDPVAGNWRGTLKNAQGVDSPIIITLATKGDGYAGSSNGLNAGVLAVGAQRFDVTLALQRRPRAEVIQPRVEPRAEYCAGRWAFESLGAESPPAAEPGPRCSPATARTS